MGNRFIETLRRFFGAESAEVKTDHPHMPSSDVVRKMPVIQEKTIFVQSRRNEDMSAEAQLAYFLDEYLYRRFPKGDAFSKISRVHDKDQQLAGIDVEFLTTNDQNFAVDEKAQLYYLNKELPTFAFELLFKRDGRDTIGWLCNPALKTDLYMLIWPYATQDTCKGITWDKFTKADCLLIHKKKLLKWLADKGLTMDRLQNDAEKIRQAGTVGRINIEGLRGVYYYASDPQRYREAPINLVITKNALIKLAQRRYIVTPEEVITE